MRRRRGRGGFDINAEITVTSLVDVAFVLLIIFLMTAPIMQSGIEVQLPKAEGESISSPEGVVVSLRRDGRIFVGDAEASLEELEPALNEALRTRNVSNIYLRADGGLEYRRVLQVLGAMKALDIAAVDLVAEPETPEPGGG